MSDGEGFSEMQLEPQLVLGVETEATYSNQRIELTGTRKILFYTDGVVDCLASSGSRFGNAGIVKAITGAKGGAKQLLDQLIDAIEKFRHRCELCDDLTLVSVRVGGNSAATTVRDEHLASV